MGQIGNAQEFRVRYSEIDRMGTFYNSRALEWFEYGRTELLRAIGTPYARMEAQGILLPVIEAHLEYLDRAEYDQRLRMTTSVCMCGKASVRFDVQIDHADGQFAGKPVVKGYTVHAVASSSGKPARPPQWFVDALGGQVEQTNGA